MNEDHRSNRARSEARTRVKRALLLSLLALSSCIVRRFTGPRLTGTCDGACSHYVECKPQHGETEAARCRAECPEVFSDRDSLMAYESLACKDAVEYIDGDGVRAAVKTAR